MTLKNAGVPKESSSRESRLKLRLKHTHTLAMAVVVAVSPVGPSRMELTFPAKYHQQNTTPQLALCCKKNTEKSIKRQQETARTEVVEDHVTIRHVLALSEISPRLERGVKCDV